MSKIVDLPLLLPAPRYLVPAAGQLALADDLLIVLDGNHAQELHTTAVRLREALAAQGVAWQIAAGAHLPPDKIGVTLDLTPGSVRHIQGYELTITPRMIHVVGANAGGAVLWRIDPDPAAAAVRPCSAHPAHPRLARLPQPRASCSTSAATKCRDGRRSTPWWIMLASWKINQLQLYTEHTFAYRRHPDVWAEASPMTGEEILALDAYCRERFIELVPNQNSFGHMRRWLTHDAYRHLAECPHGCDTGDPEWGYFDEPFSLCPGDPGSLELVRDMLDELLPHFRSRIVNVGCDETDRIWATGAARRRWPSAARARVYLDFLLQLRREVRSRGHTMQFWGDIIITDPELVAELPRDVHRPGMGL